MVTAIELPAVRPVVIRYLADQLDGVTVLATLPDDAEFAQLLPIVRVSRVGGLATRPAWAHGPTQDEPTVDLDLYSPLGSVEAEAAMDDLIKRVRAALAAMKGHTDTEFGAVVTRVYELSGPASRPETSTTCIRVGFTAALVVRPL